VLSRLDNIAQVEDATQGSDKFAAYTYLGASTIVQVAHPAVSENGLTLTYGTGGTYGGFDRFGRIVWQTWQNNTPTVVARYFYGYDRNSNRLWRADRPTDVGVPGRDEAYAYDGLDRRIKKKSGILLTPAPRTITITPAGSASEALAKEAVRSWRGGTAPACRALGKMML
jgi:hypothetical protein